jgi:hypothetical protein
VARIRRGIEMGIAMVFTPVQKTAGQIIHEYSDE